jgi:hypothetical protein
MSSAIFEIYDAIATWTPTYATDVTVNVRDVDELKSTMADADLPVRMLTVTTGDASGEQSFVALGAVTSVIWRITDRFFFKKAAAGQGVKEWSEILIKYTKDYLDEVLTHRAPTSQSSIRAVYVEPAILEWPEGGGTMYAGVDVILEVFEYIK